MKEILSSAAIVAALLVPGSLVAAPSAEAAVSAPSGCPDLGDTWCSTSSSATYVGDRSTRAYGDAGGTLSITVGRQVTTGGSISGTTTAEAGVIFAKASVQVGVTVHRDWSNSVSHTYSWTVPSTQRVGWLEAGHRAYWVSYSKKVLSWPCTPRVVKSGKILGNTSNIQFKHS